MSQLKIKNGNNWESIPAGGIGVPSGGNAGDVLIKSSSTDYATQWGKKFSSTQILPITQITQNAQNYTLSEAAENFDAFEIRLLVNGTTGSGCNTFISRQALLDNPALVFYFGLDTYWASNSFTLTGGTGAKTGTIQKSSSISSLYITVYGVKFA